MLRVLAHVLVSAAKKLQCRMWCVLIDYQLTSAVTCLGRYKYSRIRVVELASTTTAAHNCAVRYPPLSPPKLRGQQRAHSSHLQAYAELLYTSGCWVGCASTCTRKRSCHRVTLSVQKAHTHAQPAQHVLESAAACVRASRPGLATTSITQSTC
jgi:hypothetical protein